MTTKKALSWVAFWISMALCFNAGIYLIMGKEKALEFLGGYILEQSLSIDNLFLFILIFSSYGIRPKYQRRVLNYGIMGAIILRLIFVVLGVAFVNKFHWVLYIFGLNLIVSGMRIVFNHGEENIKDSKLIKLLGKIIPITNTLKGEKFFFRKKKTLYATPLFAILILVECTDIIFAVDSIPAIFSITTDLFIVYTSNIFAILSLRSMYFLISGLHDRFKYVKYGVALILTFTGVKLSVLMFHIEIPIGLSLTIIFSILFLSITMSLIHSILQRERI